MDRNNTENFKKMIAEIQDYAIILLDYDGTILSWILALKK
jgi:hypothetical protein